MSKDYLLFVVAIDVCAISFAIFEEKFVKPSHVGIGVKFLTSAVEGGTGGGHLSYFEIQKHIFYALW